MKSNPNKKYRQVVKMKSGQNGKWSKLKVVKMESGRSKKWSKFKVATSGHNELWSN